MEHSTYFLLVFFTGLTIGVGFGYLCTLDHFQRNYIIRKRGKRATRLHDKAVLDEWVEESNKQWSEHVK